MKSLRVILFIYVVIHIAGNVSQAQDSIKKHIEWSPVTNVVAVSLGNSTPLDIDELATAVAQPSNFIVYVSEQDNQVHIAHSDGSNPQLLIRASDVGYKIYNASLSPDKTKIALLYQPTQSSYNVRSITIFDLVTRTFYPVFENNDYNGKISWSSDSSKLVFLVDGVHIQYNDVGIYDLNTQTTTLLDLEIVFLVDYRDIGPVTSAVFSPDGTTILLNLQNSPVATRYNFLAKINLDSTGFTFITPPEYDMRGNTVWYDANTVYGSCLITINGDSAGEICKVDLTTNAVSVLTDFRTVFANTNTGLICDLKQENNQLVMEYSCKGEYYSINPQTRAVTPLVSNADILLVGVLDSIPPWFFPTPTPTSTPTSTFTPSPSPTPIACTHNVPASSTSSLISAIVSANSASTASMICFVEGEQPPLESPNLTSDQSERN